MRIRLDFRVFTIAAGMAVGLSGPLGAQTPNQGQQPQTQQTQSAYPTGGSTNAQNGSVGDTMGDA